MKLALALAALLTTWGSLAPHVHLPLIGELLHLAAGIR